MTSELISAPPTRAATPQSPPRRRLILVGVGLVAIALAVLVIALLVGGGDPQPVPAGIPDAGAFTGWALPVALLARDVAAAGTVGALLLAAVLAPSRGPLLGSTGARAARAAGRWAMVWLVAALGSLVLSLSDILGQPVHEILRPSLLRSYTWSIDQGRGLLAVAVLATVIAVAARWVRTVGAAAWLLVAAIVAVLPPAFTGHSAAAADHDVATSSLVLHVVGVVLWVGGLLALLLHARDRRGALALALPRFSTLAFWCFAAVGFSGVVNALTRFSDLGDVWSTSYGALVLAKAAALLVVGGLGAWHRAHLVAAVTEDTARRVFARVALGELAVMGAAMGLAVALSRSPTPTPEVYAPDEGTTLALGFSLPAFRWTELFGHWRPDTLVVTTVVTLGWLYLRGVRRLRARGIAWPVGRTISWLIGLTSIVVVLVTGVGAYGQAMISVHMVQHMTLTMLVPILLVLGAPTTLALRALPAHRPDAPRGAREWLMALLASRFVRLVTHPLVALGFYIGTLYGYYFSGLFALTQESHTWHLLIHAHFVLVGVAFFWPIIGIDPAPRNLPHPAKLALLFASMPFHAFFGIVLMTTSGVLAQDWYSRVHLPGVDLLTDQRLAGGIAWAFSEPAIILVLAALFVQWVRADERQGRRQDRQQDAGDDDAFERYNTHLAALARHDAVRQAGDRPTNP